MELKVQLIAALTGLVGTFGGVLISCLTLRHTLTKDSHRVKVTLGMDRIIMAPGIDPKKPQAVITVANHGTIPFTVANVGIQVGRRSGGLVIPYPVGTHKTPTLLERDKTCNFWTGRDDTLESLRKMTKRSHIKVRAYISDYADHTFSSNWVDVRFRKTLLSNIGAALHKTWKATLTSIWP